MMKYLTRLTFLLCASIVLMGCASRLMVKSDPEEAKVFVKVIGRTEPILLGQTPLDISTSQMEELTKVDPASGEVVELIVQKQDFKSERFMIPVSRFSTLRTMLLVKLNPGEDVVTIAGAMVQHLLNAQTFANAGEFERAHVEVDHALEYDDRFARALSMRASIYFLQGDYQESMKWYEKALKLDPGLDDAVKMLAHIRNMGGKAPAGVTQ